MHRVGGNSFKPAKIYSLENGLWLLKYAGGPTPKIIGKMGLKKYPTGVEYYPIKLKENVELFFSKEDSAIHNMSIIAYNIIEHCSLFKSN